VISPEARGVYERRGFVALGSVLEPATVAGLRRALDGIDRAPNPFGILRHNLWRSLGEFAAVLGPLAGIARSALGVDEVVLFQDNLIWKPPGTTDEVRWHQDFAYWPLGSPDGVTLWIALDEATPANGCLEYVPGTHREGERSPTDFTAGSGQPGRDDLPPLDPSGRDVVAAPALPGEALLHHPLVWHRSPGNTTETDRRAFSLTWIGTGCRWDPDHAPHPYNFELRPRKGARVEGERFPRFKT
jgi:hypothetical protein